VDGHRHAVTSADGTEIGLLTAGDGPPLLLVHGGMGRIESLAGGDPVDVFGHSYGAVCALGRDLTAEVAGALTHETLAVLDGQGHDAINQAPELLVTQLAAFFG
jgi:hypothetical protein